MNHYVTAMRRYFDFSGRSSRPEFWYYILFYIIIYVVAAILDGLLSTGMGNFGILTSIVALIHLIPSISVSVRRLHDIDRTGWWVLLGLLPLIVMFIAAGGSMAMMFGGGETAESAGIMAMGASIFAAAVVSLIVFIVLLIFYCTRGTPGPNRFGPPYEG